MDFKKQVDKALKNIQAVSKDLRWLSKLQPEITVNLYTYLFPILLQNKQEPITNFFRNNIRSTLILILSKRDFKILKKKPRDEVFRVSFKFPRCRWDQRLADFNRFSKIETRSCCSCLVLQLHELSYWRKNSFGRRPISFMAFFVFSFTFILKC